MPLFEDDTLEGAIRKAVRAGRRYEENFDQRAYGSRIAGTARPSVAGLDAALNYAGQAMESLARQHYQRQSTAIDRGSRSGRDMIPELSATIELAADGGEDVYDVSDLVVGKLIYEPGQQGGNGEVNLVISPSAVAIIHAHWLDTNPRGADQQTVNSANAEMTRRHYTRRPQFWIYKWRGERRRYA